MISLLAQSTPSADAIKDWLLVLFFLLGGGVAVKKIFFEKTTPQPLRVKADDQFVTTTSHDKDIKEIKDELKRHGARRAEIYDTQKEQGAQLAALDEKTDLMNAQLVRQEGKIDRILERLPRSHS